MINCKLLNESYKELSPEQRIQRFFGAYNTPLFTSSFGTVSAYLIHLVNQIKPGFPIHFINTRYLFEETLVYKDDLQQLLNLNIVETQAEEEAHLVTKEKELWKTEPDICCQVNKVIPLGEIKKQYEVWMSGLLSFQTKHRQNLNIFEERNGVLKFHPIIDVSQDTIEKYIEQHQLPIHPMVYMGYKSVGCKYCTIKGNGRGGRWAGLAKTECGLHL